MASRHRSAACGSGQTRPRCAQAARRCPGLELSPVTEKIIKNRTRRRRLSSALHIKFVRISGFSHPFSARARRPIARGKRVGWGGGVRVGGAESCSESGRVVADSRGQASEAGGARRGGSRLWRDFRERKWERERRSREPWSCEWRKGV